MKSQLTGRKLVTALLILIGATVVVRAQAVESEAPTIGVRYFRITSAGSEEYKGDAKALASSLRIALDNTKGFKQVVTLDDEQVEQVTKLNEKKKKGSFNRQLPGN